jgi:hypothetical protein
MSTRVRRFLFPAAALVATVLIALMPAPPAFAAYEYNCGAHRGAQCHEEPRGDESCAAAQTGVQCYGRCGPGCGWTVLGNAYTGACASHDSCVRGQLCAGASAFNAHTSCAGSLPAAVGSFTQTHWNNFFQHARDTWSNVWTKVRNCCG